ncbi:MAG: hypothetical protein VX764_06400 [Planctomycetota bacterium]|nr:hypothetical protein [Planctomycetota bacterium]
MKTLMLLMAVFVTCLSLAISPAATGPFLFTIPVVGISAESLPALETAFHEVLGQRSFIEPGVKDGELYFYGGGGGPKELLSLMEVTEALKKAGFEVDRSVWKLKEQMLGISLSSKEGIKTTDVIAALETIEKVSIEDSLLVGGRTYHVIHFGRAINYGDLVSVIRKSKLEVDDLLWGHWKYGWEIDEGDHGHSHDMGMTLIRKTSSY